MQNSHRTARPSCSVYRSLLLCLPVQPMTAAARTVFIELHPARVVAAVFLGRVITFLTLRASQVDGRADVFFGSHTNTSDNCESRNCTTPYSKIFVITPAPTVRPPSRIANFEPCSSATGMINSTSRLTLSPGITISTPSGSLILPVTSIVRM
jgi:hypothetical protein